MTYNKASSRKVLGGRLVFYVNRHQQMNEIGFEPSSICIFCSLFHLTARQRSCWYVYFLYEVQAKQEKTDEQTHRLNTISQRFMEDNKGV